jgi:hypothetical protein
MRIVSGGQTGVDRAALDAALARSRPCGGWCPRGRRAEDGIIPVHYPLTETPAETYEERTRWNVRDSDATLVLTFGEPQGGTALTVELTRQLGRPCLIVDLLHPTEPVDVLNWIHMGSIEILNVAGPRESQVPGIYGQARMFVEKLLDISLLPGA